MHHPSLLPFLIPLISINLPFTIALPPLPHSRTASLATNSPSRRDTYSQTITTYTDPTHPSHSGTLHCFTTGSTETTGRIAGNHLLWTICAGPVTNNSSFTYRPFANGNGSYPHEYIRLSNAIGPTPGGYGSGSESVYDYDMHLQSATHASYEECSWVIKKIVLDGCEIGGRTGKESRGGWFQFEDDGTTFGIDVTLLGLKGKESG